MTSDGATSCSGAMLSQPLEPPDAQLLERVVKAALEEDGAWADITTRAIVAPDQKASAAVLVKGHGVLAGGPVASAAFAALDGSLSYDVFHPDGSEVSPGDVAARVSGKLAPILRGERVALNFLQRLSGIATATRRIVDAVADLPVQILDTRKTTPGLRTLERYAVRAAGGHNHRFNLADAILIKDNHLAAARLRGWAIADVLKAAREAAPTSMRIEIEVTSIVQAREALAAGAHALLLDNMTIDQMRCVVSDARTRSGIEVEASGGVTIENVRAVAEAGVDRISVGAITHSTAALDMSLEVQVEQAT